MKDIIIIGGGIVGSALAYALSTLNLSVLLLDNNTTENKTPKHLLSAITYGCQQWLNQLNIWQDLPQKEIGVFREMKVWEEYEKSAGIHFNSAYLGIPALGYVVPNYLLHQVLKEKLKISSYIEILNAEISDIEVNKKWVNLNINKQKVHAKLLIGADGAHSWVRKQCQFSVIEKFYDHHALISDLTIEKDHHQVAYQRFHHNNILGILPLPNAHQCGLVWSGDPHEIMRLNEMSHEHFDAELQSMFGDSLGKISSVSKRICFPLIMRHAQQYIKDRIALVGDAAHTIHPLAGQGLNLGLWDAQFLTATIANTLLQQRDFGLYQNLRPYERIRRHHNQLLLNIVAFHKWFFSQSSFTSLRQLGLNILNNSNFLKQKIMHLAAFGINS